MSKDIIKKLFPELAEKIEQNLCPFCSKPIGEFKDKLSLQEYKISGLCQACQDKVFTLEEISN